MAADELSVVLKAREFVSKARLNGYPASVETYAAAIGAKIRFEQDMGPDEAAYTVPLKDKPVICVNAKDRGERQRFSVCHEIAHMVLGLPSEHSAPAWSYAKRSPNEILCDVFAAELLLPYTLFKPLVDRADANLAAIDNLATDFDASFTATGSRFAALSKAPCAFILSEQGLVRYASRSTALRQARAWIPMRMALPDGSVSKRVREGISCSGPEEIEPEIWISEWDRGGVLLEEARHFKSLDQTLALLCFEDEELPPERGDRKAREEEEYGLAELDGQLPWPGKRRRK